MSRKSKGFTSRMESPKYRRELSREAGRWLRQAEKERAELEELKNLNKNQSLTKDVALDDEF